MKYVCSAADFRCRYINNTENLQVLWVLTDARFGCLDFLQDLKDRHLRA